MKNKTPVLGGICRSVQGRDKDRYYIISRLDGEFVFVADGNFKRLAAPKRKNIRHLYLLPEKATAIAEKLAQGLLVYDTEIYSALKTYNIKSEKVEDANK